MKKRNFSFWTLLLITATSMFPLWIHAAEDSLYDFLWLDPDKAVYVLQNKVYKKENTFGLQGSFIKTVGNEFQKTFGFDVKGVYFFQESWGVEAFYSSYNNSDSDNYNNVVTVSRARQTDQVIYPFVRRLNSATGLMLIWSPFYGKVNTFNKIFYFDWSFGLGFAHLNAESNLNTVSNVNDNIRYDSESYSALAYKTEFKFHLNRHVNFSFEVRNFTYQAAGPSDPGTKKFNDNWDLLFGVGYKF